MEKIQIQFSNISEADFLDVMGLRTFPEIGETIEVAEGVNVINGTLRGIGFTDSVTFQILYPVVSGVAVNIFAAWLYERLKNREGVQITIGGRKTDIDPKNIEAKILLKNKESCAET